MEKVISRSHSEVFLVIFSVAVLLASNFFRIHIPGITAPITLQTFCVITSAYLVPRKLLMPTLSSYFLLTMTFFNPHGFGVIPVTFGYILGMLCSCIYITKFQPKSFVTVTLSYTFPLLLGSIYLSQFMPFEQQSSWALFLLLLSNFLKLLLPTQPYVGKKSNNIPVNI